MRCAAAVILALSFLPAIRSAQAAPRRLLAVLEFRNQLPANQRKAAGEGCSIRSGCGGTSPRSSWART
jgi:hypothetical protein